MPDDGSPRPDDQAGPAPDAPVAADAPGERADEPSSAPAGDGSTAAVGRPEPTPDAEPGERQPGSDAPPAAQPATAHAPSPSPVDEAQPDLPTGVVPPVPAAVEQAAAPPDAAGTQAEPPGGTPEAAGTQPEPPADLAAPTPPPPAVPPVDLTKPDADAAGPSGSRPLVPAGAVGQPGDTALAGTASAESASATSAESAPADSASAGSPPAGSAPVDPAPAADAPPVSIPPIGAAPLDPLSVGTPPLGAPVAGALPLGTPLAPELGPSADAPPSGEPGSSAPDAAATFDEPGDEPGSSSRGVGRGLLAALAVLALLAVIGTALLAWQVREQARAETARTEALEAARDAARLLFSYDHEQLEQDFEAGLAVTTGDFREEYERTTREVVTPVATQYDAVVQAEVVEAGVVSAEPDRVVTVVYVNQTTTSTRVEGPKIDQSRVRMVLRQQDGEWLVDRVDAL